MQGAVPQIIFDALLGRLEAAHRLLIIKGVITVTVTVTAIVRVSVTVHVLLPVGRQVGLLCFAIPIESHDATNRTARHASPIYTSCSNSSIQSQLISFNHIDPWQIPKQR